MLLLLVRHGQTVANADGILQGHLDTPLAETGFEQAALLATRLKDRAIDVAYSSDLLRARQTAEVILQNREIPLLQDFNLRERSYGSFQGSHFSIFNKAFAERGLCRETFRPDGGENHVDVEKRISVFLQSISEKHPDETVLVVAHSGTNRAILQCLLGPSFAGLAQIKQDNTCLNELEISSSRVVKTVRINCTDHLDAKHYTPIGLQE